MNFNDNRVLITGGASGIGKIMGRMALEKGAKEIVIWDINQAGIDQTVKDFEALVKSKGLKGSAKGFRVDVSNNDIVKEAYQTILDECGYVDILINCAGVVTSNKTFDQQTAGEIVKTININTIAPMLVTLSMLSDMITRDKGHVCTIASAGGMISNPKMSVYGASKWGVIGWSDSMRIELKNMKSKVGVTTIAPFYINTGMFDGVKSTIFPILDPEKTAATIIRAIEKNKTFCGIPFGYHFIRFFQALLPTKLFDIIFGEWFGIYHTMDNFTGRKRA